jgi:hypothetical protein
MRAARENTGCLSEWSIWSFDFNPTTRCCPLRRVHVTQM